MNRFKIAFFMMTAMICIAATSWGDSMSLNNNNDFIVANEEVSSSGQITQYYNITFKVGEINTDTLSPEFCSQTQVIKSNWGVSSTISLNDNNTFIEANLGAASNKIYYNAGKIDPITHEITFTDTGFSFNNNEGWKPNIYLDNNGNFIEVHRGTSTLDYRIVRTNKFPFFKKVPMSNLYYVTGKIDNDGKIIYLNTGKYCGYGETPIITTTDDNIFTEIHAGPDSGSPYSIIGSIDNEGNFLSQSGEGIEAAVAGHELKNQTPLAVKMTNIEGTKGYNVNLFTEGDTNLITEEGYFHILNGSLSNDGQIVWNCCVDIPVQGEALYSAANDRFFISFLILGSKLNPDLKAGSYKVISL